ncbi:MAG TPA: PrsW family glutamic-type intramembrane protease [Casimicrobiaceae bacterium]|nr:PrsW family glutamic-type intramembrane protease [Casimicrobiaceae bacterium]
MPHYQPLSYSIVVASVIPLVFLFIVKWLNFFETHRFRLILLALAWGAISLELSYLTAHPMALVLGRPFVSTHISPFVEEVFKSLVLLYLVRRADTTFFVDGAVYGFACGIGFAIAENMLYLSRVDVDTGVVVGTVRAFISSVGHGSFTAIVGMALAGFPLGRIAHPLARWLAGLAVSITLHTFYNNRAFHNFVFGHTGLLVLAAISFGSFLCVALAILWGLSRERRKLRRSLGTKMRGASGEARLVRNIDDLNELLAPVEERFGELKREQVENALRLSAELAMKQDLIRKTRDPEIRAQLAPQITELKRELKQARGDVGIYIMSYVRSIVPKVTWSIWARLGKTLESLEAGKTSLWKTLGARLVGHNTGGQAMYARLEAALQVRAQSATLAIEAEED